MLIVMIGLPGSGKSYVSNILSNQLGCKVLSSDSYRKKLFGDENDQTHNQEVFVALYKDMRELLLSGQDVIFDATNTTLKSRRVIFDQLKGLKDIKIKAVVIPTSFETCLQQDASRARTVGRGVIYKFYSGFQFPQKFEGFDEIEIYGYNEVPEFDEFSSNEVLQSMLKFDQQNPHHLHSLGVHCKNVAHSYSDKNVTEFTAGLFHDIGKLFTQQYDEQGIAHYYQHDSIGTYHLMCNLSLISKPGYSWNDIFEVLFFVNYHMKAHKDFRTPKAYKKYKSLFGEELYNRLIKFADMDIKASGTDEIHDELMDLIKVKKVSLQEFRQTDLYKNALNS